MNNSNTENLEKIIEIFLKDQSKENKVKMLTELEKSRLLLPAVFPKDADVEALKEQAKGGKMKLADNMKPIPCFIKSTNGETFLPVYSSKQQMPKDKKPQVVMELPFSAAVALALQENLKLTGIALNPFSGNILLREPFLKMVKEQEQKMRAAAGAGNAAGAGHAAGQQVKLTPEQVMAVLRRKAELEIIPKALYENPKEFADTICDKREAYVRELYGMVYKNPGDCPYKEEAFSIMPLNIRDNLLLVRIDLPAIKQQLPVAVRAYVLYDEEKDTADYYTVEMGKEKGTFLFGHVAKDLAHESLGEDTVEGAELQAVLDFYDARHKEAN